MKPNPSLALVLMLATLAGCSNSGTKLAKASEAFAECSLAGNSKCIANLDGGAQLTFSAKPATLFYNNDSVRVESVLQQEGDCVAFGKEAGNGRNTSVVINDVTVKMYGDERDGAIKRACEERGPYRVAVTVAKVS